MQYLIDNNLKSYLAAIPDNVSDGWDMAELCYKNGGEIVAHSLTVLTNENQTFELMNEKFLEIPSIIGENGFPVYGVIRAGGTGQGTENRYMDEYYCKSAGLKYSDYYGVNQPFYLERINLTRKTLSEWRSYLDNLVETKGYCITFCHHVNGAETNSYPNGFTMSDFKAIISEIKSRDIEVMTINELVDKCFYKIDDTQFNIR